jgi:hypothetical protein
MILGSGSESHFRSTNGRIIRKDNLENPFRTMVNSSRMIYSTKSLRPGLVVQDPVRDAKGMILLPAGVLLTDSHIAQLLQRGVPAISVAAQENEEEMLARLARERERIASIFGETGATPELEQLRRLLMEKTDAC